MASVEGRPRAEAKEPSFYLIEPERTGGAVATIVRKLKSQERGRRNLQVRKRMSSRARDE